MTNPDIVIIVTESLGKAAVTGKTAAGMQWVYDHEGSDALNTCYVTSEELTDIRIELLKKNLTFEMR